MKRFSFVFFLILCTSHSLLASTSPTELCLTDIQQDKCTTETIDVGGLWFSVLDPTFHFEFFIGEDRTLWAQLFTIEKGVYEGTLIDTVGDKSSQFEVKGDTQEGAAGWIRLEWTDNSGEGLQSCFFRPL